MSIKGVPSHQSDPQSKHDADEVNVRPVYQFLLWLGLFVVATYFLVWGIFKWNDARIKQVNEAVNHIAKSKTEQLPPEPRLQLAPGHAIHPLDEGMNYRDSVARALESFGFINRDSGLVKIPIDLAKEILLKRGFATRAMNQATPAVMIPEFSSSGRTEIARDQRIPGGTYTVTGGNVNVREKGE